MKRATLSILTLLGTAAAVAVDVELETRGTGCTRCAGANHTTTGGGGGMGSIGGGSGSTGGSGSSGGSNGGSIVGGGGPNGSLHNSDTNYFTIRVDDNGDNGFYGYGLRLIHGYAVVTPVEPPYTGEPPSAAQSTSASPTQPTPVVASAPPLPEFYVTEDTQVFTASSVPWQLYIDSRDGSLRYTHPDQLPEEAIAASFFHTGDNPLGLVGPSPSYFTWPSTEDLTNQWNLCPIGGTGEFQVYASYFTEQGVAPTDTGECAEMALAAVNAY